MDIGSFLIYKSAVTEKEPPEGDREKCACVLKEKAILYSRCE